MSETGKVKWYNETKGYGFIAKTGGKDLFVHISNISDGQPLYMDDEVSFDITETPRGPAAINVKMIRESQSA
jgi:CspA family cold shock protein